jgi:hypothetical protein
MSYVIVRQTQNGFMYKKIIYRVKRAKLSFYFVVVATVD